MNKILLNEKQVAERMGLSVGTVRGWRFHGIGPVYHKFGRSVRYYLSDIETFIENSRVVPALAGD